MHIAAVATLAPETLDAVRALHPSLHGAGIGHLLDRYRASHPKSRHIARWIAYLALSSGYNRQQDGG